LRTAKPTAAPIPSDKPGLPRKNHAICSGRQYRPECHFFDAGQSRLSLLTESLRCHLPRKRVPVMGGPPVEAERQGRTGPLHGGQTFRRKFPFHRIGARRHAFVAGIEKRLRDSETKRPLRFDKGNDSENLIIAAALSACKL
jgi:hypothetical protein